MTTRTDPRPAARAAGSRAEPDPWRTMVRILMGHPARPLPTLPGRLIRCPDYSIDPSAAGADPARDDTTTDREH
jgi:hypothetical protein